MSLWNSWPVSKPKDLIEKVFRVSDFDRNGVVIDEYGKITGKSAFKPYGYLKVESPDSAKTLQLPIIHKDDFALATFFFDDQELVKKANNHEVELLVTYSPLEVDKNGFSISPLHCLHYALCSYGTIGEFYQSSTRTPELIFGDFIFAGGLSIKDNLS